MVAAVLGGLFLLVFVVSQTVEYGPDPEMEEALAGMAETERKAQAERQKIQERNQRLATEQLEQQQAEIARAHGTTIEVVKRCGRSPEASKAQTKVREEIWESYALASNGGGVMVRCGEPRFDPTRCWVYSCTVTLSNDGVHRVEVALP